MWIFLCVFFQLAGPVTNPTTLPGTNPDTEPVSLPSSQTNDEPGTMPASLPTSLPMSLPDSLPNTLRKEKQSESLPTSGPWIVVTPQKKLSQKPSLLSIKTDVVEAWIGALFDLGIGRGDIARAAGQGDVPPGIRLSSARLRFGSTLEELLGLSFYLETELSPVDTLLFPIAEAHFSFRLASASIAELGRITFGQIRVPFGLEASLNREEQSFIEQGLYSQTLAPGRQVGVLLNGEISKLKLRYDAGLFTGNGPNALDQGGQLFTLQLSGLLGAKTRAKPSLRYSLGFAIGELDRIDTGFDRYQVLEASLLFQARQLSLGAEIIAGETDAVRGFDAVGSAVWAGYFLIPEYLEILVRAEELRLDISAAAITTQRLSIGATLFYLQDRYRLQYNAIFSREQEQTSRGGLFSFVLVL